MVSAARPAGFELGPAPLHEPLAYPGAIPACSFLLAGGAIEAVDDADPLNPDGPLAAAPVLRPIAARMRSGRCVAGPR